MEGRNAPEYVAGALISILSCFHGVSSPKNSRACAICAWKNVVPESRAIWSMKDFGALMRS